MATFYQRYCDGDRQNVWDELFALKDLVNEDRYLSDAQAVAAETMKRARHNVEKLLPKLDQVGYEFLAPRHPAPANHQVVATRHYGNIEYEYQVFTPPPPRIKDDLAPGMSRSEKFFWWAIIRAYARIVARSSWTACGSESSPIPWWCSR
jgi:hypothetical protein